MSPRKGKAEGAAKAPRARSAHNRQRQRLIDACISALHIYGPSRTTVEKVVAIAKMSPGIVRFYFDSKAAMLVASLQFLAAEFEEQVLGPVSKLKQNPVAALELLVDLYLDPEIASPRKVSVWYAFWGEASSRQEYYDICGQKDESFAALVRELVGRLIDETSQPQLDTDGIALGLIGVLEMLWQDFAFRTEEEIDRAAAKRRCMAYLASVFPGQFSQLPSRAGKSPSAATVRRFAGWAYGDERAWSLERDALFQSAWQIAAHESQLDHAGDFLTLDIGVERVLLVRDAFGVLHALRNSCPEVPHALVTQPTGRFDRAIECPIHGLQFALDGRRAGSTRVDLTPLEMRVASALAVVRSPSSDRGAPPHLVGWCAGRPEALKTLGRAAEVEVAANWKLLAEQWLETASPGVSPEGDSLAWTARAVEGPSSWSTRAYRSLVGPAALTPWTMRFIAPNQLLQSRPDGATIWQLIPTGSRRSRLRRLDFTATPDARCAGATRYLAARLVPCGRRSALEVAESAQRGVIDFGYRAAAQSPIPAGVTWFRRYVAAHVPALTLERPPTET
ncbi:MAG TPA: TetR family transcriptional regulator C-terminal domain-containing protein [Steroidobacteraceae bacterium]|nr:TetR family transcriptional regulator C-terminal domain-containing protein [Steroidobacteraceae bacterium]